VLLREQRELRRMSQLDLAHEAGLSARHLGFIEVGKAQPSREAIATPRNMPSANWPIRRWGR
jgi:DNA-binding XRE family transcriptional regulator